jgi:hypothetical protein
MTKRTAVGFLIGLGAASATMLAEIAGFSRGRDQEVFSGAFKPLGYRTDIRAIEQAQRWWPSRAAPMR